MCSLLQLVLEELVKIIWILEQEKGKSSFFMYLGFYFKEDSKPVFEIKHVTW